MKKFFYGKKQSSILAKVFSSEYSRARMTLIMIPIFILFFIQAISFSWTGLFKLLLTNCVFYSLLILSSEEIYLDYKKNKDEQLYLIKFFLVLSVRYIIYFFVIFVFEKFFIPKILDNSVNYFIYIIIDGMKDIFFIVGSFIKTVLMFLVSLTINVSILYYVVEKIIPAIELQDEKNENK